MKLPYFGFLSHGGTPPVLIHFERWDFPLTNQLLGIPHGYGKPHIIWAIYPQIWWRWESCSFKTDDTISIHIRGLNIHNTTLSQGSAGYLAFDPCQAGFVGLNQSIIWCEHHNIHQQIMFSSLLQTARCLWLNMFDRMNATTLTIDTIDNGLIWYIFFSISMLNRVMQLQNNTGWWFGCHFLFSHSVGNVIIPIDELIFFSEGWPNHQPEQHLCLRSVHHVKGQQHPRQSEISHMATPWLWPTLWRSW